MIEVEGVEVRGPVQGRQETILTAEALAFVAALQREFGGRRRQLLQARAERQARIEAGETPHFLPQTRALREGDWRTAPPPPHPLDRPVEITRPPDPKMGINAPNSGA